MEVCLLVRNYPQLTCERGLGPFLCNSQHGYTEELCYRGFSIWNLKTGYVTFDDSFSGLRNSFLI